MNPIPGRGAMPPAAIRLLGLSLLVSISGLGCSATVGASSGSPGMSAATATAAVPAATATAPAVASATPTIAVESTLSMAVTGVLLTEAAATEGELGSYAIDGQGSDAPWLPFGSLVSVEIEAGQPVSVRLLDGGLIRGWVADLAAWDDTTGSLARRLAEQVDGPAVEDFVLGPLPQGRWVLAVRLFRADARGDGTTFWAVTAR